MGACTKGWRCTSACRGGGHGGDRGVLHLHLHPAPEVVGQGVPGDGREGRQGACRSSEEGRKGREDGRGGGEESCRAEEEQIENADFQPKLFNLDHILMLCCNWV